MNSIWLDLRYGIRLLLKTPVFTAIALVTLALGIGANTAVFSVVNAALLRPMPFDHPERIVAVWEQRPRENAFRVGVSAPDFVDWRRMSKSFSNIALYDTTHLTIGGTGSPERIAGATVSPGFLEALGVQPRLGRTFVAAEEESGRSHVAVITDGLWRRRFASDPAVIGKSVDIDGEPSQVVGVLSRDFRFPFAPECDMLVPLALTHTQLQYRGIHAYYAIARMKSGVTLSEAKAEMALVSKQLEQQYPDYNTGHAANIIALREDLSGKIRPALGILLAAVFLVVLIACANVANLLLARATVRRREMAVRAALGCSRWRLARQSLLESALLAIMGTAAGILPAIWGLDALRSAFFSRIPFFAQAGLNAASIDWRVLVFTLGSALLSMLLFGASPALASADTDLNDALRSGGRGATGDRSKFRNALIVAEVALSLLLLTGAGLMGKSFLALMNVNPGFQPDRLLIAGITLPKANYKTTVQASNFHDSLLERAAALPGVRSAALTDTLPLSGEDNRIGIKLPDRAPRPGEHIRLNTRLVSRQYLETMGIRLLAGREFTPQDMAGNRPVAILSETAARQYWQDGNALGKRFAFDNDIAPWIEIIGIAAPVHNRGLADNPTPDVYLPYRENPFLFPPIAMSLVLRTTRDGSALGPPIRNLVASLDASLPVSRIRTMETYVSDSTAPNRFNVILLGIFAVIAVSLASAGIYGVMSYLVGQRTNEIGVRMALGARPADVLKLVVGKALLLAGAGVAAGMAAALLTTRVMSSLLFAIAPRDPLVFTLAPLMLLGVAALASYIPARRAARIDPLVALRME